MLKKLSKLIFWSLFLLLFCLFGYETHQVEAATNYVQINEFFNDATGTDSGNEWVELYNPSENDVDMTGYVLYAGHLYSFPDGYILESKKIVVLHLKASGSNSQSDLYENSSVGTDMNNSHGSLALFCNNSLDATSIIDFVQYGEAAQVYQDIAIDAGIWSDLDFVKDFATAHSTGRIEPEIDTDKSDDWQDFKTPSPGVAKAEIIEEIVYEEDEFADEEDGLPLIAISKARQTAAGENVKVSGVVTVLPNKLSEQYFYIQDPTAGIQVYCYKKDFPNLVEGDLVEITGEISDYYTDKRIKIDNSGNIKIIGRQSTPEVKNVTIDDIGDNLVGQIVEFEGEVSSTSGATFYLHGSGEIKINIKDQTNINKPRMGVGDKVRIIGVVSKYKDSYQVLPFDQAGVTILTSGKLPSSGKKDFDISKSIIILSLWKLSPRMKKKLKNLQKTTPKS